MTSPIAITKLEMPTLTVRLVVMGSTDISIVVGALDSKRLG